MKNYFAILVFVLTITALSAQTQKGNTFIGGTLGFTSVSVEGSSATVIEFKPTLGHLVANRFALGASLGLSVIAADGNSYTTIAFSPFARGYFKGTGTARFFGQFNVGIQSERAGGGSLNSLKLGPAIGADFFLTENVAIEGTLSYDRANYLDSDAPLVNDGYNTVGLNFGVLAFLGRSKKE